MTRERRFTRLNAAQTAELLRHPELQVFDARSPEAHAAGHLPQARQMDGSNYERILFSAPKARPVLIYCYHGNASQTYAQMFIDFGFSEVYDLIGGYAAWDAYQSAPAAAWSPSPELAAWLRAEGFDPADPKSRIANASTPLMHAARQGNLAMAEALLAQGVALDAVNADGNNALWLACFNGDVELVRCLAAAGVPIDRQNDNGATCLMYAASAGKAEVAAALLAGGADASLRSADDFSALDMAATLECLSLLRRSTRLAA
ncbi:MAG: hypothetical protein HGA47_09280 [Zoogloea sp.]|nr:hypothetical protein [Zoogloea sp.]